MSFLVLGIGHLLHLSHFDPLPSVDFVPPNITIANNRVHLFVFAYNVAATKMIIEGKVPACVTLKERILCQFVFQFFHSLSEHGTQIADILTVVSMVSLAMCKFSQLVSTLLVFSESHPC